MLGVIHDGGQTAVVRRPLTGVPNGAVSVDAIRKGAGPNEARQDGSAPIVIPNGLYSISGMKVKGTKRPLGIAKLVRYTNNPSWFAGSALYMVDPAIQFFEYGVMCESHYVIVANVPATDRIGKSLTIFVASGHGTLFGRYHDAGDFMMAEIGPRLVGSTDHRRVLSALQGGYLVYVDKVKKRGKRSRHRKE